MSKELRQLRAQIENAKSRKTKEDAVQKNKEKATLYANAVSKINDAQNIKADGLHIVANFLLPYIKYCSIFAFVAISLIVLTKAFVREKEKVPLPAVVENLDTLDTPPAKVDELLDSLPNLLKKEEDAEARLWSERADEECRLNGAELLKIAIEEELESRTVFRTNSEKEFNILCLFDKGARRNLRIREEDGEFKIICVN